MENILSGNPLINLAGQQQQNQNQNSFRVKRRYVSLIHTVTHSKNTVKTQDEVCIWEKDLLNLILISFPNIVQGGMMT